MDDKRYKDGKTIKETLGNYLQAMGIDKKVKETDVLSSWEEMMGDAVAKRTEKLYIKEKILYLELNSSVMRDELRYAKSTIIKRLNDKAGFEIINNIYFR